MTVLPVHLQKTYSESEIQGAVVDVLKTLEAAGKLTFCASMNGLYLGRAAGQDRRRVAKTIDKAHWQGMRNGEPDLYVLAQGRVLFLEIKAAWGRLSDAQKARHAAIEAQGAGVHTIKAKTPPEAVDKLLAVLDAAGAVAAPLNAVRGAAGAQAGRMPDSAQIRERGPAGAKRAVPQSQTPSEAATSEGVAIDPHKTEKEDDILAG